VTPERCLTCSDEAVAARVTARDGAEATVALPSGEEVPDAAVGDLLLCHAGIALARLEVTP
jgi:hypothetical protein